MCNLCSNRLFIVPNPCCCCELRCGIVWIGIFDIILAIISLYYPTTLSANNNADFERIRGDRPLEAIEQENLPVFEVTIPWASNSTSFKGFQRTGCYAMQIVNGIMIALAAKGLGGRNLTKFVIGCIWIICRLVIFATLASLCRTLRIPNQAALTRYSDYLIVKLLIDIYFIICVRYFTMECYDAYRYDRIIHKVYKRREPPVTTKAARRYTKVDSTRDAVRKKRKRFEQRNLKKIKAAAVFRNALSRKNMFTDKEAIPVWDRKNERVFVGEDYTDWDPVLFQTRWEILDEKRKQMPDDRKSAFTVSSLAMTLLKAKRERENQSIAQPRLQPQPKSASHPKLPKAPRPPFKPAGVNPSISKPKVKPSNVKIKGLIPPQAEAAKRLSTPKFKMNERHHP